MTEQTPQTGAGDAKKDVVPSQYRERYKATGGTTGDFVGVQLQKIGKDGLPALHAVMKENGIAADRWGALNPGQQRMNLSNVLRSRLFKGESITILGKQYNIRHMLEDYNGTVTDGDAKSMAKFLEAHDMKSDERTIATVMRTFFAPSAEDKAKERADAKAAKAEAAAKVKAEKAEAAATAKAVKAKAAEAAKAEKAAKAAKPAADAKAK